MAAMEKALISLADLETEAKSLAARLSPKQGCATLVTLSGELGAGKTTFTQAVAKAYGVKDSVTSPTFVLQKVYDLPDTAGFRHLIHIDAYRLEGGEELTALGWNALMDDSSNLILLEWPENVADALPHADVAIALSVAADSARSIAYA